MDARGAEKIDLPVFQVSYLSSAAPGLSQKDIEEIHRHAERSNQRLNISGILLYRSGIFLQLLEGKKDQVQSLYHKIERDRRHTNVIRLFELNRNPRLFSDWSMAFKEVSDLELTVVEEVLSWNRLIKDAHSIENDLIMQLFAKFKSFIED